METCLLWIWPGLRLWQWSWWAFSVARKLQRGKVPLATELPLKGGPRSLRGSVALGSSSHEEHWSSGLLQQLFGEIRIPGWPMLSDEPLTSYRQVSYRFQERSVPSGHCTLVSSRNAMNDTVLFPVSPGDPLLSCVGALLLSETFHNS